MERKPFRLGLVVLVAVVVLGVGMYFWFSRGGEDGPDQATMSSQMQLTGTDPTGEESSATTGTISDSTQADVGQPDDPTSASGNAPLVVVFGVETFGETSRPDAVAVIGIDRQTASPIVVSLQPDQEIGQGENITSAYERLGPLEVAKSIGSLLSLPLTQYIVLDYQVFESIIDRLGGIQVPVDEAFAATSADGSRVTLQTGTQSLDGRQALAYIRYKWAGDETARVARHAAFLQSLRSRLSQRDIIGMLPALIRDVFALVETNITLTSAVSMIEQLSWSEMSKYRLIVVADEVSGGGEFSVYRTPAGFAASGVEFAGIEQAPQ